MDSVPDMKVTYKFVSAPKLTSENKSDVKEKIVFEKFYRYALTSFYENKCKTFVMRYLVQSFVRFSPLKKRIFSTLSLFASDAENYDGVGF
ncbi:hypothetical protein LSM04_009098 [Trypanosoma melophagium]|uniref:uncharacterized protein n=1 Tax=Trypanosoma melophagium TaxID=715481 RepID=UPI00351A595C|nr:hypothetical protein LSM04_009098 [Trypanosoma melophagium]